MDAGEACIGVICRCYSGQVTTFDKALTDNPR